MSLHYKEYDIPFSGQVFYESLNTSNNAPFSQIGIFVDFTDNETNSGIYMDADAHIIVKKTMFNAKKIKDIPKGYKFELIDLPEGNYSIKFVGTSDSNTPTWKKIVISISVGIIVIGIFLYIYRQKDKNFISNIREKYQKIVNFFKGIINSKSQKIRNNDSSISEQSFPILNE